MADQTILKQRTGFGLATVMARKGVDASAIGASLGLPARDGPFWTRSEAVGGGRPLGGEAITLLGTGAGSWLAHAEQAPADWAEGAA